MSRTIRRDRAAARGRGDSRPLFVRSLSSFTPPQQRLLRALLEADQARLPRSAGGAASRVAP
jgi:hypothetical protein